MLPKRVVSAEKGGFCRKGRRRRVLPKRRGRPNLLVEDRD
jgi:hypothetical protein